MTISSARSAPIRRRIRNLVLPFLLARLSSPPLLVLLVLPDSPARPRRIVMARFRQLRLRTSPRRRYSIARTRDQNRRVLMRRWTVFSLQQKLLGCQNRWRRSRPDINTAQIPHHYIRLRSLPNPLRPLRFARHHTLNPSTTSFGSTVGDSSRARSLRRRLLRRKCITPLETRV